MKKTAVIGIILLFLAAGGGWYFWAANGDKSAEKSPAERPPQAVSVLELETTKIRYDYSLPGRISPFRQSQVRPQVDGIITERLFEEGADVKKGQQLYQIDDARYKAALNSTIADLKSAEANVKAVDARAKRYKDLVKINAVSEQEYDDIVAQLDQAKASVAVAQAAYDLAQVNLDYTKVYAPIDGRISKSFVTEGALVTANQSQHLATITQLDPVYVDMQQSGTEAMHIRTRMIGQDVVPVTLVLDEKTGQSYGKEGMLKFSEVTVEETTGSVALRALMPNPDGILLPGLFVRATIALGEEDVILIPQRAATRTPDGKLTAWIVDEQNRAQPRELKVDHAYEDNWIVTDGVKEGDRVVVLGYQKIGPGMVVAPTNWKQASVKPNTDQGGEVDSEKNKEE
ncbi:MAG: efflux transporter periplasmic adaptor subunit [Micavibrio sp.]|nr:efflux transporter periplasmic adaptor subunit [Micavibrio sp.]|tara:strand:- start:2996 stop:4195 length:1200 start_codon:yes stop_codon:yes gene_type:complete